MLMTKAVAAYALASLLAVTSIVADFRATQVPWLSTDGGQTIGLWKFTSNGYETEFPSKPICYVYSNFCTCWRTATFLFTLALLPESLVLLAIIFSWTTHHRKKTVWTAKYLLAAAATSSILGIVFLVLARIDLDDVMTMGGWRLVGGWWLVVLSIASNLALFALMFRFRRLVRSESRRLPRWTEDGSFVQNSSIYSDSSSGNDNDDNEDDISVPEDIPPEQIDFYIFNVRARRQELARRMQ